MEERAQKTGIIYARVSSKEQVEGTSLDSQVKICREYAARHGIAIREIFIEKGESAKTADRTELTKAIGLCAYKTAHIDYFIVYKLDRFARNHDDHGVVRAALKRYGTVLRSATEPIDETPTGRLMEAVIAGVAEFDNSVRADRSKNGMLEKVRQGVWVWPAPLGYTRLTPGGNLVVDEARAPYIRLAFEEWAKGTHSFKTLARFLYARGFRTRHGSKVYPQLMAKMLRNPLYCGLIRAFDIEIKGAFAPLIDEDVFWKCQPAVRRTRRVGQRISENPAFPLRKMVICPACSHTLTGSFSTGRKGVRYAYYHHQKQGCRAAAFYAKDTFEQTFIEFLDTVSPRHTQYEKAFRAIVMDVWQSNYKQLDAENARVRKEIKVLEGERQRIFDLHREGVYTDQEFLEQKDRTNVHMQQKKLLLEEKRLEELHMDEALDYCFALVRDSAKTWIDLEALPALRWRFQNMIFPEKLTFDGNKFGTTKMPLVYELNRQNSTDSSTLVTLRGIEPRFKA